MVNTPFRHFLLPALALAAFSASVGGQTVDLIAAKQDQTARLSAVEQQLPAAAGDDAKIKSLTTQADAIRAEDLWHKSDGPPALTLPATSDDNTFHPYNFVLLSDLHLSERQGKQRLNKVLSLIAERHDIAFVLVLGDIVWDRNPEDFKPILAKANVPVHLVYGNNDWKWVDNGTYEKAFGPRDFTFTYANTTFVCLYDCLPKGKFPADHKGDFTPTQWSWMEEQLKDAQAKHRTHTFVAMHIPPLAPGAYDKWFTMFENTETRFWDLLKRYDVHGAFFGHLHQAINWTHDGIPCSVTPSDCWNFADPKAHKVDSSFARIVHVDQQGITDALIPVHLDHETFTYETLPKFYDPNNHPK